MLTTADIAARFGVARKTVTDVWTKRPDFPPPIRRINRRLVWWDADEVERWATTSERSLGRSGGALSKSRDAGGLETRILNQDPHIDQRPRRLAVHMIHAP